MERQREKRSFGKAVTVKGIPPQTRIQSIWTGLKGVPTRGGRRESPPTLGPTPAVANTYEHLLVCQAFCKGFGSIHSFIPRYPHCGNGNRRFTGSSLPNWLWLASSSNGNNPKTVFSTEAFTSAVYQKGGCKLTASHKEQVHTAQQCGGQAFRKHKTPKDTRKDTQFTDNGRNAPINWQRIAVSPPGKHRTNWQLTYPERTPN